MSASKPPEWLDSGSMIQLFCTIFFAHTVFAKAGGGRMKRCHAVCMIDGSQEQERYHLTSLPAKSWPFRGDYSNME